MNRLSIHTLVLSALLHTPFLIEADVWMQKFDFKPEVKKEAQPTIYYVQEKKKEVGRQVKKKVIKQKKKKPKAVSTFQKEEVKKVAPAIPTEFPKPKKIKPKNSELKPVVEDIDLSDEITRKIFFDYYDILRKRIQQNTLYPYHAKQKGMSGIAYISFVLARSGDVKQIVLLNSSGYSVLDEAAMNSVRKAEPFPQFPEKITPEEITLKVPISFEYE